MKRTRIVQSLAFLLLCAASAYAGWAFMEGATTDVAPAHAPATPPSPR